ncbi:hypothetical protein [Plantactinospora endophytica]|uniref:Uncharacterized protein n=1 Tax=Plantactinospora endophytica TaxID=673535 RepID=A0ABQ4EDM1_9ACTN|nr:hypothetical protein [Plantactinospora endophytica]GIG92812.1 hypothetical protein Pen02_77480 [Plantactinospora endophytica]
MSQPQPEETAPAGRATPTGPSPADGSATVAAGDQHGRVGDQVVGGGEEAVDIREEADTREAVLDARAEPDGSPDDDLDQPTRPTPPPDAAREPHSAPADPVGAPSSTAADPPTLTDPEPEPAPRTAPDDEPRSDNSPRSGSDNTPGSDGSSRSENSSRPGNTPRPDDSSRSDNSRRWDDGPGSDNTPRPDDTPRSGDSAPSGDEPGSGDEADQPTRRTAPPDATRVEQPAGGASGAGPVDAVPTVLSDEDEDGPTTTRVAAPRWTGSAAVPPPRPRKRRWLRGDAEPADVPAAPTRRVPAADPTMRMPGVEADEDDIPTPVDPWAGAADDPWDAHAAYPSSGGHPGPASHPPVGHDTPVSPPPARQLPVTRKFPAPTGPPPPTPPHPASRPRSPHAAPPPPPPPHAAPPPPAPARTARPPAPPAPRKQPAPPVAPPRPPKQRRRSEPPPPVKKAPRNHPPVPVRRRRRWPRVMLTLTLLSIACCCGIPAYYAKPIWDQYPASPVDPLPSEVLDLQLVDNASGRQAAEDLKQEVRTRNWFTGGEAFAGVYRASNGKQVVVFGSTGFRLSPESAVQEEITRLQDEYAVTGVESLPTGVRGEFRSCGTGKADGDTVVVCTWADHGSLATALFTRLSIPDSSELLGALRDSIILREPVGANSGSASTG